MILTDQVRREVSDALAAALLPLSELVAAIERSGVAPVDGRPGWGIARPEIVLRHPLDPEFAEVRRIDVLLAGSEHGWRIHDVRGLPSVG